MSAEDLKLYMLNAGTVGVTSLAPIEDGLKILLLIVTIGYTMTKRKEVRKGGGEGGRGGKEGKKQKRK